MVLKNKKKMNKKLNLKLNKFYTKEFIAEECYLNFQKVLKRFYSENFLKNICYIEPSAGSGVFLKIIEGKKIGFDIEPTDNGKYQIQKLDFLQENIQSFLNGKYQYVFLGNPPFGKKAKLAIDFINKAFEYSEIVGFILPIQFLKWSAQSQVIHRAKLVDSQILPENAFEFLQKEYSVRCCFQIWTTKNIEKYGFKNQRIEKKPEIKHIDFEMYQYNRTEIAKKYFDYDWDFAVPRQGYLDYSFKAYKKDECNPRHQWIFFKAKNQKILKKLMKINFEKLSQKNTGLPGFGKADVIEEYIKMNDE